MKIIFLEDYKVNKCGDIVNLNDGYVKNFLIPKFKVLIINKILFNKIKLLINLILLNDFKKKLILKKLFNKFNNKNLIFKIKFYKFFYYKSMRYILKKIGFLYYDYKIISITNQNIKEFFIKINIYNNININFILIII